MNEKITGGPPYENFETEIKTPEELAKAKETAGVRSRLEALAEAVEHAEAIGDRTLFKNAFAELRKEIKAREEQNKKPEAKEEGSSQNEETDFLSGKKLDEKIIDEAAGKTADSDAAAEEDWVMKRAKVLLATGKCSSFDEAMERAEKEDGQKSRKYTGGVVGAIDKEGIALTRKEVKEVDRE